MALTIADAAIRHYSVQTMCRILDVAPSGYYKWLKEPLSNRAQHDARLLRLIRAAFLASHGIYGAPRGGQRCNVYHHAA